MKRIRAYQDTGFNLPQDATIVSLSPFMPDGEFGGAIRSREINKAIKEIFPSSYTLYCHNFNFNWVENKPKFLDNPHHQLYDIHMLHKNFHVDSHFEGTPDAIIFDHPWLWYEAKRIKERYPEVKLIHSSHNIEYKLKRDLLVGLDESMIDKVVNLVEDVEIKIAQEADLVICVTESDKEWFVKNGAQNVLSVNNGTNAYLSQIMSEVSYALVVGSGHPPNIEGSIKYLKDAVDWLPENTDLIFVGTMCGGLSGKLGKERNESRNTTIRLMGKLPDSDLNKLIESANIIALPIPYGGGSNLKTAEALISGRPIVGTPTSFRGFEKFKTSQFVRVTESESDFRKFITEACTFKITTVYRQDSENLSWSGTTENLKEYLRSISGTSS